MFTKLSLFTACLCCITLHQLTAQVGIGTTTPDPSAVLDISSTSQGMLAPRMTTAERVAISNPSEGLLVFDVTEDAFYYYNTTSTSWIKIFGGASDRSNFVLVQSEADFPSPSGGVITLDEDTYYEINGLITLTNSIDLNNAYISGLDSGEDILSSAGTIFAGTSGGSIRNITITGGGTAFNITGGNSLLLQNTIIDGMSSVGTISGVGVYFSNIVQYINNTDGITYNDVGNLLLSNQGWFGNNSGIYERYTGSFALIEKVSGFSTVAASATGVDVSGNPTVGNGVIIGTVFSGAGTYVEKYTTGSYPGYNFTTAWTINCPGIPKEFDDDASGNFYYDGSLTSGFSQSITNNTAVEIQGSGSFSTTNLFRFSGGGGGNQLTYEGSKSRDFQINASLSVNVNGAAGNYYAFVIAKNGTVVTQSNAVVYIASDSQIQNVSLNTVVSMDTSDYIELYVQRLTGTGTDTLSVFSENLSIK